MKKIIYLILFSLFLNVNLAHATVGWSKNIPATSENPQAISPDVIQNNTAIDLMLQNYRDGQVTITLVSTSQINIGAGGVMLENSGGSTRLMVANSTSTSVSPTNIDTGSISASSTYYLYAYTNSVTATTFSVVFSASSVAPVGETYYQQLGSFTTDAGSNFVSTTNNVYPQVGLGSWTTESFSTIYQAPTDGFVIGYLHNNGQPYIVGYTDSSSSPSTERWNQYGSNDAWTSICMPVRKNDYWEAVPGSGSDSEILYFLPLGS